MLKNFELLRCGQLKITLLAVSLCDSDSYSCEHRGECALSILAATKNSFAHHWNWVLDNL